MSETPSSHPKTPPAPRKHTGLLGTILLYTRGMIFDQRTRRLTMFYALVAAMLLVFVGDLLFGAWLQGNLVRFVVWVLVCGWLTLLAALLAVYDLLMLRVQHRLIRRELRERLLKEEQDSQP